MVYHTVFVNGTGKPAMKTLLYSAPKRFNKTNIINRNSIIAIQFASLQAK